MLITHFFFATISERINNLQLVLALQAKDQILYSVLASKETAAFFVKIFFLSPRRQIKTRDGFCVAPPQFTENGE